VKLIERRRRQRPGEDGGTTEQHRGRRCGLSAREGWERANERHGRARRARGLHLGTRSTWAGRGGVGTTVAG
jgi:hypothetical protein